MTEQSTPAVIDDNTIKRAWAAKEAQEILSRRHPILTPFIASARDVIGLASWIVSDATPPTLMAIYSEESEEPILEWTADDGQEPMLTNSMLIEFTYDSPISQDTVDSIVASHENDEGILRVRGRLVP